MYANLLRIEVYRDGAIRMVPEHRCKGRVAVGAEVTLASGFRGFLLATGTRHVFAVEAAEADGVNACWTPSPVAARPPPRRRVSARYVRLGGGSHRRGSTTTAEPQARTFLPQA